MRNCCCCGEEDIYKPLIRLNVTILFEGKQYTRTRMETSENYICFDCLLEEAENIFAFE
ncbi:hypothetical protein [Brevibacillus brevis]|uniref:hypothetical protein n=1 Tax=Brevibacillus brevis TaxID=1393 RepID=UPI0018FF7C9B|nr:hypothetical protein [Brevibacillus brevis]